MKRIVWIFLVMATLGCGAWAQGGSSPTQSESVPTVRDFQAAQIASEGLPACPATAEFQPEEDGVYKVGGGVLPPKPKNRVEPEFTDEARRESNKVSNFRATVTLSLIVDTKGKPQDICVRRAAPFGLDNQAVKAAKKYRFQPATKEGVPVAVRINVQVDFIRVY